MDRFVDKSAPPPTAAPARRKGLLRRFARSRGGVTAIEFAMVAIPFLGLLCAIFETAFIFFVHEAFDSAVGTVAREVATNQYSFTTAPTSATLMTANPGTATNENLKYFLPSFINSTKVVLNVQCYTTQGTAGCTQVTGWSALAVTDQTWYTQPAATTMNLGVAGDIVVFQAFYPMPVYLSVLVATGSGGVSDLYNHASGAVMSYGSGFVHAIFSTFVFRNEPSSSS